MPFGQPRKKDKFVKCSERRRRGVVFGACRSNGNSFLETKGRFFEQRHCFGHVFNDRLPVRKIWNPVRPGYLVNCLPHLRYL